MRVLSTVRKLVSSMVALAILSMSLQSTLVNAAMVSTETLIQQQQVQYDRAQLLAFVNQDQAKQTLIGLGVKPEDVEARINNMTAAELAQFNSQVDQLPAGGNAIFGAIVFILLLLIVLDLLGATDVFPAIRPINVN